MTYSPKRRQITVGLRISGWEEYPTARLARGDSSGPFVIVYKGLLETPAQCKKLAQWLLDVAEGMKK